MSLKCSLNISYKVWFTPSSKNGYLQCAQLCFFFVFFFFQISSKLNLFSCRDGIYSLSMILSVCFDVKKTLPSLGVKAFIDLIWLHLFFFFNTLTVTFLLKHYSIKKYNFSGCLLMLAWQCFLNVSLDFSILSHMFLKLVFLKKTCTSFQIFISRNNHFDQILIIFCSFRALYSICFTFFYVH